MDLNNKIVDFLDDYTSNKYNSTNEAVDAVKEIFKQDQTLQLRQTGVKSSVFIEFKEWSCTCGDDSCTLFGTKLILNGKELEHPNEEITDNSYVGDDIQTAIHAILKELGYDVKFG